MKMLRKIREERKFEAAEVAVAVGVTPDAVRRWERGLVTPRLRHQRALQDFFQIPAEVLLAEEDSVRQQDLLAGRILA